MGAKNFNLVTIPEPTRFDVTPRAPTDNQVRVRYKMRAVLLGAYYYWDTTDPTEGIPGGATDPTIVATIIDKTGL